MSDIKKERWTEAEVSALPTGEHDYFDRKSGRLLLPGDFRKTISKAICALANSGGGHLLLGVNDDGGFDGMEPLKGNTRTREWLEQLVPNLLSYPLANFRVHEVEPATPTAIPQGRVVIVIDVGDSVLAPHQSPLNNNAYYYRAGGHSIPAPHFYLETLRSRLVSPVLEPRLTQVQYVNVHRVQPNGFFFIELKMWFEIKNTGRIAAYKWSLQLNHFKGCPDDSKENYRFNYMNYPAGPQGQDNHRIDATILPSLGMREVLSFGIILRIENTTPETVSNEFNRLLPPSLIADYRVVTETSAGESVQTPFAEVLDYPTVLRQIVERL